MLGDRNNNIGMVLLWSGDGQLGFTRQSTIHPTFGLKVFLLHNINQNKVHGHSRHIAKLVSWSAVKTTYSPIPMYFGLASKT